jgi:uncharacterized protein (TIGR00290 family)
VSPLKLLAYPCEELAHPRHYAATSSVLLGLKNTPMTNPSPKVLLSWSSGKDSAWALHVLRQQPDLVVVGLLTTFNEAFDRVAMHAVRRELVEAQAAAAGLPLVPVMLPFPCTNEVYEDRMKAALEEAKASGVTHMAFGDLFLVDVREYRVRLLQGTGVEPLFPIWTTAEDTPDLARRMLAAGLGAVLTCVDPKQLSERFVGRRYDETLLAELPAGVDPCGERGEFHTFCYRCPEFSTEIAVSPGEIVEREGFWHRLPRCRLRLGSGFGRTRNSRCAVWRS